MPKNTQLLWIAEAEARRFREMTVTQRATSEPQISVVSAMHGAARSNRWRRLVARLTPTAAGELSVPLDVTAAHEVNSAQALETAAVSGSGLAALVETSFDAQRG